jgi:hypothetical protein
MSELRAAGGGLRKIRIVDGRAVSGRFICVKTITIEDLHERTGSYVQAAQQEPIVIADGGRQVAVLKPLLGAELEGRLFPVRDPASLPKVAVETSRYISEDRDGR